MRLARVGDRSVAVLEGSGGDRMLDLGPRPLPELFAELDGIRDLIRTTDAETLPPLDTAALRAPVVPRTMLCLGYNYRGHVPDGVDPTADDPSTPDVFVKTPNTFGGPNDPVVVPAVADDVDYEGEIAVVIGRRAHGVALDDALSYVAGYTLLNDVSDRSWQRRQSQWALGKCFDGFAPLGPWMVTADEVDPRDLVVEVVRDGEVTVSQSTATTIFSVAFVVHYLSQVLTLDPGDVISTGTPQKLARAQDAHRPLAPGDAVIVRVAGIGELTTTFIAPSGVSA
ncbi:MAG: fumarylacetoacetate hydrolase family protein [Microbacterium enclense]